jgi:hypothetical protein
MTVVHLTKVIKGLSLEVRLAVCGNLSATTLTNPVHFKAIEKMNGDLVCKKCSEKLKVEMQKKFQPS